jgi:hypothetical protein
MYVALYCVYHGFVYVYVCLICTCDLHVCMYVCMYYIHHGLVYEYVCVICICTLHICMYVCMYESIINHGLSIRVAADLCVCMYV